MKIYPYICTEERGSPGDTRSATGAFLLLLIFFNTKNITRNVIFSIFAL